ncbi:MAG TPA: PilZ domain-containing protein [Micropepsaceae bacterium]|jgi:hypothetical protein
MNDKSPLPFTKRERRSADRRQKRRPAVELRGEIRMGRKSWPVLIGEIPGSGALVFTDSPPPVGNAVELWIEGFGAVPVEVVHSSRRLCGLVLCDPAAYRAELLLWLRRMLKTKTSAQPKDRRTPLFFCARVAELASYRSALSPSHQTR